MAREILDLLKKSQRGDFRFFEKLFENIIKSFDKLEDFKEAIEHCHRLDIWRPLGDTLTYQSYSEHREIYDNLGEITKKWEIVSANGWFAARSLLKEL